MQGVEKLFLLSSGPRFDELELAAVEAAQAAGVRAVVKVSAIGASADAVNPFFRAHARVERALEASGMAFTILRPNFFMQNWVAFYAPGIQAGQPLYLNAGEGRMAWIDARDIADVAVAALTETGHAGFVYELTGPEPLGYGDVAARLGRLLGREITCVAVADGVAFNAMKGMGMDPWYAYGMVTLHQAVRRGLSEATTGTVELVTGRPPRDLESFLKEHLAAFA